MKNYLLTLLFVSALTGGIVYLSTGSFYEKYVRYLATILSLLALLSPLPTFFSSFEGPSEPEISLPSDLPSEYGELLKAQTEKRLNEELTLLIIDKCALSSNDFTLLCHISLNPEQSTLTLESISVTLHSLHAISKREALSKHLSDFSASLIFTEKLHTLTKEVSYHEYSKKE